MLRYVNLSPVGRLCITDRPARLLRRAFRDRGRRTIRIHRDFAGEVRRERGQRHSHGIVDLFIHCVIICPAGCHHALLILGYLSVK